MSLADAKVEEQMEPFSRSLTVSNLIGRRCGIFSFPHDGIASGFASFVHRLYPALFLTPHATASIGPAQKTEDPATVVVLLEKLRPLPNHIQSSDLELLSPFELPSSVT
jgi:hypothetical protein